ncbi:MAG: glycosyltransferase family 2 protein [Pseudooceanicola sp.]|nr:glycosyltransferase family 2 protein [Pseudooceanicola sp.]
MDTERGAGRWTVAAVVKERAEVLRRFIAWHVEMGAAEVALYFDDPADPNIAWASEVPNVRVLCCTPEFWLSRGVPADASFNKRQIQAIQHAYETCATPWLLLADGDELIHREDGGIEEFLAAQPAEVRSILVEPVERVIVPGARRRLHFRRKLRPRQLSKQRDGALLGATLRRGGLTGHTTGKSFLRTGIEGVMLRQHFMQQDWATPVIDLKVGPEEGMALLHMIGTDYDDWRAKLPHRLISGSIRGPLKSLIEARMTDEGEAALPGIFAALFELDARTALRMRRRGQMLVLPNSVGAVVRKHFGRDRSRAAAARRTDRARAA